MWTFLEIKMKQRNQSLKSFLLYLSTGIPRLLRFFGRTNWGLILAFWIFKVPFFADFNDFNQQETTILNNLLFVFYVTSL